MHRTPSIIEGLSGIESELESDAHSCSDRGRMTAHPEVIFYRGDGRTRIFRDAGRKSDLGE